MFNICVCDDDQIILQQVEKFLSESTYHGQIKYEIFTSAERFMKCQANDPIEYNLYLLDIEMGAMNGLELAAAIRRKDRYALIAFMTSYSDQYVYDVFDVGVFDFIRKPITQQAVDKLLKRAVESLDVYGEDFIYQNQKVHFSIPLRDIMYIEKDGRKAMLHTRVKTYVCNMNINDIWEQLDEERFVSVYSAVIVNIAYIEEIKGTQIRLINDEVINSGRNYIKKVKDKHLKWKMG